MLVEEEKEKKNNNPNAQKMFINKHGNVLYTFARENRIISDNLRLLSTCVMSRTRRRGKKEEKNLIKISHGFRKDFKAKTSTFREREIYNYNGIF